MEVSAVIEKVLTEAQRFPSGDNVQPFFLKKISDHSFHIYHDQKRAEHDLNFKNVMSHMALGAYLTYLELAALKNSIGFKHSILHLESSQEPWAQIDFIENHPDSMASEFDKFLMNHLTDRYTERRPFKVKRELPPGFLEFIEHEKSRTKVGFEFSYVQSPSKGLLRYLGDIEKKFWTSSHVTWTTFQWLRLTRKEIEQTRDGMPAAVMGVPSFTVLVLYLMRRWEFVVRWLSRLGLASNQKFIQRKLISSSSLMAVIWLNKIEGPLDWVEVGRTYTRQWVWLSAHGWGFQPVTIGISLISFSRVGLLPATLEHMQGLLTEGQNVLTQEFKANQNWYPVWGYRAGPLDKMKKIISTLRKDIPFR